MKKRREWVDRRDFGDKFAANAHKIHPSVKRDSPKHRANLKQYSTLSKVKLTHAQLVESLRVVQEQVSQLSSKVERLADRIQEMGDRSFWQRMFRR